MKRFILLISIIAACSTSYAQADEPETILGTFRETRVVNGHSVETSDKGQLKMLISHRFGAVNGGGYEFFGLDQSTIRIGFDYGISNDFTVGIGRSSFEKTFDAFGKYRILKQKSSGMPISLTWLSTISANGLRWAYPERENFFSSRLVYAHQLLISKKFHPNFSWQLMPTVVHRNLVPDSTVQHDVISIGSATRWQITKSLSIQTEYYFTLPNQLSEDIKNSLSIGVDIVTKGHVFQLHLSNSRGMIEKFFITETRGNWLDGDIHLGFNITRDFRIRGRK